MKPVPRIHQRHDLYKKYHGQDSEISRLLGECGLNGVTQGSRNTNADLQFGLAYAWDKNTTLRADARAEVLGDRNFTAGITLTRTFGRK